MLDRKQMVAEIADEVVSRLLTHLDAPATPAAPTNGARAGRGAGPEEEAGPDGPRCLPRPWTRRSLPRRRRRCAWRRWDSRSAGG